MFKVPTRDSVTTTLFWEPVENTKATVFLFPGGGFGKVKSGRATGNNFLVRSATYFLANGFNVAIFGRPNDSEDLYYSDRISDIHMTDARLALDFVKKQSPAPAWVIGTSRGRTSATATAIHLQDSGLAILRGLTNTLVQKEIMVDGGANPSGDICAALDWYGFIGAENEAVDLIANWIKRPTNW